MNNNKKKKSVYLGRKNLRLLRMFFNIRFWTYNDFRKIENSFYCYSKINIGGIQPKCYISKWPYNFFRIIPALRALLRPGRPTRFSLFEIRYSYEMGINWSDQWSQKATHAPDQESKQSIWSGPHYSKVLKNVVSHLWPQAILVSSPRVSSSANWAASLASAIEPGRSPSPREKETS